MSHSLPYLFGILLVVFVIDFTLRALPLQDPRAPARVQLRSEYGRVDASGNFANPCSGNPE